MKGEEEKEKEEEEQMCLPSLGTLDCLSPRSGSHCVHRLWTGKTTSSL